MGPTPEHPGASSIAALDWLRREFAETSGNTIGAALHGRTRGAAPTPGGVERRLTPHGVVGITTEGQQVMDVHNTDHPGSRNREGANDISIGFTSHYQAMRKQFGAHLADGIAGENILVETEQEQSLADLERGIAIKRRDGEQFVHLSKVIVATPCIEFSQFTIHAQVPPSNKLIKETLQFLNDGRRGFYATLPELQVLSVVQAGDILFAL